MKAITTKFFGAANHRGFRIKAIEPDGISVTIPYDHAIDSQENHARTAIALCRKLGWRGTLGAGYTKTGMVFVWIDNEANQYEVAP